jgi:hypothetical protein
MYLEQLEVAQAGVRGNGTLHLPAWQTRPASQVFPQAPQLLLSLWRSLQVSGVVPQREEAEPEQGQLVAVAVSVAVTVSVGVMVAVASGTVVKTVSVNWVVVVKTIAVKMYAASARVVVVVT